jgi:hypothetical protein
MSVIGTFTPAKDGGWTGSIRTLSINAKVRLVPNDNRDNENAPAFRVFVGQSRIGRLGGTLRRRQPEGLSARQARRPQPAGTHQRRVVPVRGRERGATRVEQAEGRRINKVGRLFLE